VESFVDQPTRRKNILYISLSSGGEGRVYSADEGRDLLEATGWKSLDHRPLAALIGWPAAIGAFPNAAVRPILAVQERASGKAE